MGRIAAVLAVAMFFTQIVDTEGQVIDRNGFTVISLHVETLFIYLSAIVAMIGYIISWWHKFTAGILLVLAGSFFIVIDLLPDSLMTPSSAASRQATGEPGFGYGIPASVAGGLFLWYWGLTRKSAV